jgi:hypothetical protein
MSSHSEVTDVAERVARFIESNGIRFERGTPRQYFTQLGLLSASLTLPIVPEEQMATVLLLKNYCNLWNIVVDDEIDREGRKEQLDASTQVLLSRSRNEVPASLGYSAARTLDEVLTALPTDPAKAHLREVLYFDLWEEMNGFRYEYCINKVGAAANPLEYGKYSTMTASIKHFLDLDCLFATHVPEPASYRLLRKGYEHFGLAVKFASDLGTLKRELLEEDNLNSVRILAQEAGITSLEGKLESEAQYDALLPSLVPVFDKVRQLATDNLEAARLVLANVPGVETRPLLKSISGLIETYRKRDPFFRK